MENPLIGTSLNGDKFAVDPRAIYMISENSNDSVKDNNGRIQMLQPHCLIYTDKQIIRVDEEFDSLMDRLEDINNNIRLGI